MGVEGACSWWSWWERQSTQAAGVSGSSSLYVHVPTPTQQISYHFTLGGFLDYGVPLPPTQCVITPGQKCPPDKTTHAISGNWFCDLKRQPGFREVTSLSLYSVENGRMPHYHQVETLAPWRVCIQTLVHGHPPPPVPPQTPG